MVSAARLIVAITGFFDAAIDLAKTSLGDFRTLGELPPPPNKKVAG